MKSHNKNKKKREIEKVVIKKLAKISKESEKLFKEDKDLMYELKREINVKHRKAS